MSHRGGPPESQYIGICPTCGKHRYDNRRDAKRAARAMYPGDRLRAYRCGDWWHIGHVSPDIRRGDRRST